MNRAYVEIEVETGKAEAEALMEALRPESTYGRSPFTLSRSPKGFTLKFPGGPLGDARVFANSALRLLKVARECIQAVD